MKKQIRLAACLTAVALAMASCGIDEPGGGGGNDDDTPGGNGNDETPGTTTDVMSPAKSKDYLNDVALEVIDLFNPNDQREVLDLTAAFIEKYSELDSPFGEDDEAEYSYPVSYIKGLNSGLRAASASTISRAAIESTYSLSFSDLSGVYEPGSYEWRKVAESNDIVFRFTDNYGNACELKAAASGGSSNVEFNETYEDEYWDYDSQEYVEESYTDHYQIAVPRTVKITLTCGGKTLASATVNSSINLNAHTVSADVEATVANISVSATTNGVDSSVKGTYSMTVGGRELVVSNAEISGSGLCNKDKWENALNNDNDVYLSDFVTRGTAEGRILNKVRIEGSLTYNKNVEAAFDHESYDEYYYPSQEAAKEAADADVNTINRYMDVVLKLGNSTAEQAHIKFQTSLYEDYYWWEYEYEPVLEFADETTYSFDEYFGRGFGNVETDLENLIDSYESIVVRYSNKRK